MTVSSVAWEGTDQVSFGKDRNGKTPTVRSLGESAESLGYFRIQTGTKGNLAAKTPPQNHCDDSPAGATADCKRHLSLLSTNMGTPQTALPVLLPQETGCGGRY